MLPASDLVEIGRWDPQAGRAVIASGWAELVKWCGSEPDLDAHTYRYDIQRCREQAGPATRFWIEKRFGDLAG